MIITGSVLGIFLISSLITLVLDLYEISSQTLYQIIVVLFVLLLFLLRPFFFSFRKKSIRKPILYWTVLFLSSLLVQILVLSTGGFYSPFLILIHLFVLSVGFFINWFASISFLLLSLAILILNIWFDYNLRIFFYEDPWSVVLYFISFLAIIPLSQLLVRRYRLKDKLSTLLGRHLQVSRLREEAVLQGLTEMIVVTNRKLQIISVNEATRMILGLTNKEMIFHPLFEIIKLKDRSGSPANEGTLSINEIQKDKAARITHGLLLYPQTSNVQVRVDIQVRPIVNLENKVEQIVLVINEAKQLAEDRLRHHGFKKARAHHDEMMREFKETLRKAGLSKLRKQAELLSKSEGDLLTAFELEGHAIKENLMITDVIGLCRRIVDVERDFAQSLGVQLRLMTPDFNDQESLRIVAPKGVTIPWPRQDLPDFTVTIDPEWLSLLLQKLLDVAILLSSEERNAIVRLVVLRQKSAINIKIIPVFRSLSSVEKRAIFTQYFGSLGRLTNLSLGSGLEGFLAKSIATQLKLKLVVVETKQDTPHCTFLLQLPRGSRK